MLSYALLAVMLAFVSLGVFHSVRTWMDSRDRCFTPGQRLAWALVAAVKPSAYWWGARLDRLAAHERATLIDKETRRLQLDRVDSLRCPLCGATVHGAWRVGARGELGVGPGPILCPRCDFRLDSCRHCAHFLLGPPQDTARPLWLAQDLTTGRCEQHKQSQPVEQACAPAIARQLRARGYDWIRAPMVIVDSYLPPDDCRAFRLDRKRLRANGVRVPDARQMALIRLLEAMEPGTRPRPLPSQGASERPNPEA